MISTKPGMRKASNGHAKNGQDEGDDLLFRIDDFEVEEYSGELFYTIDLHDDDDEDDYEEDDDVVVVADNVADRDADKENHCDNIMDDASDITAESSVDSEHSALRQRQLIEEVLVAQQADESYFESNFSILLSTSSSESTSSTSSTTPTESTTPSATPSYSNYAFSSDRKFGSRLRAYSPKMTSSLMNRPFAFSSSPESTESATPTSSAAPSVIPSFSNYAFSSDRKFGSRLRSYAPSSSSLMNRPFTLRYQKKDSPIQL